MAKRADESAVSRILFLKAVTRFQVTVIHLGPVLPRASSNLPGNLSEQLLNVSLFGLAPGGVCPATPVTWRAGGLLHHRFTLTAVNCGGLLSVALIPRVTPGGRYPPPRSEERRVGKECRSRGVPHAGRKNKQRNASEN